MSKTFRRLLSVSLMSFVILLMGCKQDDTEANKQSNLIERLQEQQLVDTIGEPSAQFSVSVSNITIGRAEGIVTEKGITGGKVLSKGDAVAQGATIETGTDSAVVLRLPDGAVIGLAESSSLRLVSLGGTEIQLELQAGHMALIHSGTASQDAIYSIFLPDSAGVISQHPGQDRHLAMTAYYDPATSDLLVTVLHGGADISTRFCDKPQNVTLCQRFSTQAGKRTEIKDSHDRFAELAANQDAATWSEIQGLAIHDMLHGDFAIWLGALEFAEIDPAPFPVLAPYLDSDPDPFPVSQPDF